MEARRLAVLCSHLCPQSSPFQSSPVENSQSESSPVQSTSVKLSPVESSPVGISTVKSSPVEICLESTSDCEAGRRECVFCRIIHDEAPAFKLYEDEICLCILDSNPLTFGHSLIIPKLHFPSLEATPPPVVASICSKVPFLSNAIMRATNCDSFNLIVNNGTAAGQVIFHTHFHIIPRKAGDKLWPSESFRRKSIEKNQETSSLVECIRENINSSSENCGINSFILPKDL